MSNNSCEEEYDDDLDIYRYTVNDSCSNMYTTDYQKPPKIATVPKRRYRIRTDILNRLKENKGYQK